MDSLEVSNPLERTMVYEATVEQRPISGTLELTPLCNMNCDMCYVRLSPEELKVHGSLQSMDEWVRLAEEMADQGVLFLLLTGGEPLLYPRFRELYLKLMNMGFILTINTNGTLIDEDWADFFGENRPRRINITLYGTKPEVYGDLCHYPAGYEKTIQAIRLLQERGVDVKINGSVTTRNAADCCKLSEIAKELHVVSHTDAYMYPAHRERSRDFQADTRFSPEETAKLDLEIQKAEKTPESYKRTVIQTLTAFHRTGPGKEQPGKIHCRAGRSTFIITWNGMMRPCVMLNTIDIPVFEKGFAASWKELTSYAQEVRLSPKCQACEYRNVCTVCAASALHEEGAVDAVPEYICRYTKEKIRLMEIEAAGWQKKA